MKIKYIEKAKEESLKSDHQHKIGAIFVKGNRILAKGYNQIRHLKIGKKYTNFDCSLHAERDCLSKLDKENIFGGELYIYRHRRTGEPGLAKPCPQCMWMIKELGVKRIMYSINEFPYWEKRNISYN
jgi:deoxycytidylate deaminase